MDPMAVEVHEALRRVLARTSWQDLRGGAHLRYELTRALPDGSVARQHHHIHVLCAALDENVPRTLYDAQPVTAADVIHLADHLGVVRGWSSQTAAAAVQAWVSALDLTQEAGALDLAPEGGAAGSTAPLDGTDTQIDPGAGHP